MLPTEPSRCCGVQRDESIRRLGESERPPEETFRKIVAVAGSQRMKKEINETVHVVLASDSATSAGLAVAGHSAIKHTSRPLALWVIQESLDTDTIASLHA